MSETSVTFTGILLLILVVIIVLLFLYHYVFGHRERFWSNSYKEEKVGLSHKLFKPNGYMVCKKLNILSTKDFFYLKSIIYRFIQVRIYFLTQLVVLNDLTRSIKKIIIFWYSNLISQNNNQQNNNKPSLLANKQLPLYGTYRRLIHKYHLNHFDLHQYPYLQVKQRFRLIVNL